MNKKVKITELQISKPSKYSKPEILHRYHPTSGVRCRKINSATVKCHHTSEHNKVPPYFMPE